MENPGKYTGFVAQEQFRLTDILANRFGRYYAPGGTKDVSGEVVVAGKAGHQRRLSSTRREAPLDVAGRFDPQESRAKP